jgi:hypothetical protein
MRKHRTFFFMTMFATILVTSVMVLIRHSFAQYPPCSTPDKLARTGGATWARNAPVTVVINPDDFPTDAAQQAIRQAFTTWQNAHTNSGVTFTFTTGSNPQGAMNSYYVHSGPTTTGGNTNIGYLGSPSTQGNITTSVITVLDSSITRAATLTNIMLHEIGHSFGLDDCLNCAPGSTMMSTYQADCYCPSFPCDQTIKMLPSTVCAGAVRPFRVLENAMRAPSTYTEIIQRRRQHQRRRRHPAWKMVWNVPGMVTAAATLVVNGGLAKTPTQEVALQPPVLANVFRGIARRHL